jgi:hypothetical protein
MSPLALKRANLSSNDIWELPKPFKSFKEAAACTEYDRDNTIQTTKLKQNCDTKAFINGIPAVRLEYI